MGARQGRVNYDQWDTNNIQQATGLSPQQIQQLKQQFFNAAGRDGVISRNEFPNIYSSLYGGQGNISPDQIERIFRTFDRDNTGSISFDEFLNAMIMNNHNMPRQDRIGYVIRQNNPGRGDGRISAQYGHQVLRRLNDYYNLPPGTEHQCWKQIDRQNRGYVTEQEMIGYIRQQEAYGRRYR